MFAFSSYFTANIYSIELSISISRSYDVHTQKKIKCQNRTKHMPPSLRRLWSINQPSDLSKKLNVMFFMLV